MPIHDWSRVDAGIFHHFHQNWMIQIAQALNSGVLPADYYALAEQFASGFGPDVRTLQSVGGDNEPSPEKPSTDPKSGALLAPPKLRPTAETDMAFYRRRQNIVAVRHVSGDSVVAVVEIVSPGNKAARNPFRAFVQKAADLIESGVHLVLVDPHRPGRRDPNGIHAAIWEAITDEAYRLPAHKPLTLAAYESGNTVRAYVAHAQVGEALPEMPLFLEPGQSVEVPLESTYSAAFADMPARWRRVLETATHQT